MSCHHLHTHTYIYIYVHLSKSLIVVLVLGYTCRINESFRGCCFWKPIHPEPFSCQDCCLDVGCCLDLEYCVSCCMRTTTTTTTTTRDKIHKMDPFAWCLSTCRTSSPQLVHENTFVSNWKHCFATSTTTILQPPPPPKNDANPLFWFMEN